MVWRLSTTRRELMNCFVIMPYAREFYDVYATIKGSVEGSSRESPLRCFRLDLE
jgi:hypothetical protein